MVGPPLVAEHIRAQEKWDEIAAACGSSIKHCFMQAILSQKIVYQYQAFAQAVLLSSIQRTEKHHL